MWRHRAIVVCRLQRDRLGGFGMSRSALQLVGLAALLALPNATASVPLRAAQAERRVAARTNTADDQLKDRIEHRIETNRATRKYDIKVDVAAGVATLTGDV